MEASGQTVLARLHCFLYQEDGLSKSLRLMAHAHGTCEHGTLSVYYYIARDTTSMIASETSDRHSINLDMTPEDPNFPHEEYALLLGSTAPGTASEVYSRPTASKSSVDVALADIMCDARPSGVVLPKILRRKLNVTNKFKVHVDAIDKTFANEESKEAIEAKKEAEAATKQLGQSLRALQDMARVPLFDRVAHYDAKRLHSKSPIAQTRNNYDQVIENDKDDIRAHLPKYYETPHSYRNFNRSRVFTVTELEKKLSKANAMLLDIQKQLHRGEEVYFQDTDLHGNIYKGWEAFIDAKPEHLGIQDVDTIPYVFDELSALSPSTISSAPSRKMHIDSRWFSSSSYSVENGSIRKYERRRKSTKKSSASGLSSKNPSPAPPMNRLASPAKRRSPIPPAPAETIEVTPAAAAPPVEKAPPFFPRKVEPRTERSYVPPVVPVVPIEPRTECAYVPPLPMPAPASTPPPGPSSEPADKNFETISAAPAAPDKPEKATEEIISANTEPQNEVSSTRQDTEGDCKSNTDASLAPNEDSDTRMDGVTSGKASDVTNSDKVSSDQPPKKSENEDVSKDAPMESEDNQNEQGNTTVADDENENFQEKESIETPAPETSNEVIPENTSEAYVPDRSSLEDESKGKKRTRDEDDDSSGNVTSDDEADDDNADSDTRSSTRLRKRRK